MKMPKFLVSRTLLLTALLPAPLLTLSAAVSEPQAINAVTVDYNGNVTIGDPWILNQSSPIKTSNCLQDFHHQESAPDSEYRGQKVSSFSEVQESLGIGISASARGLAGKVTAKANFSRSVTTSAISSTFVGRAHAEKTRTIVVKGDSVSAPELKLTSGGGQFSTGKHIYPFVARLESLPKEIQLTEKAQQKLSESTEAFRDYCGDGFVYSIFEGVEVYGFFRINQVAGEVATTAEAMISGNTLNYEAGLSAYRNAKKSHKEIREESEFRQYGGSGQGINPTNLEDFFKVARSIRQEVSIQGKPIRIVVASYQTIPECRESRNCPSFSSDENDIILRSFQLTALQSTLQRIDDIAAQGEKAYTVTRTQSDLRALRTEVYNSIQQLEQSTRNCLQSAGNCSLTESDPIALIIRQRLQLPLAYRAYPRQYEYELSPAAYRQEVVSRTLKEISHQLCERYYSRDSRHCNQVKNLDPATLSSWVAPVTNIAFAASGTGEKGHPYQNARSALCLDVSRGKEKNGTAVILYGCKKGKKSSRKNQIFGTTSAGNLKSWNKYCVETHKSSLRIANCGRSIPNQTWLYTTGRQLRQSGLCLSNNRKLETCDTSNRFTWLRKNH